jgi:hypothetical protein
MFKNACGRRYHFVTTTCAIIGGVFTVAGIVDGLIHTGTRFAKKVRAPRNPFQTLFSRTCALHAGGGVLPAVLACIGYLAIFPGAEGTRARGGAERLGAAVKVHWGATQVELGKHT